MDHIDGGSMLHENVSQYLPDCTVLHTMRQLPHTCHCKNLKMSEWHYEGTQTTDGKPEGERPL
jgi:hypothetical protein